MIEAFVVRSPGSIRVAVTGHRAGALGAADPLVLEQRIDELLQGIGRAARAGRPGRPLLLSALAEGADRLVAERALACEYDLVVLLPFPPHVYEEDFASSDSRAAFRELLKRAAHVEVVPAADGSLETTGESRAEAYVDVGNRLARDAEVLVALWDGEPARGGGGTAEVVAAATERLIPVVWVQSATPHEVRAFSPGHAPTLIPPPVDEGVAQVIAASLATQAREPS